MPACHRCQATGHEVRRRGGRAVLYIHMDIPLRKILGLLEAGSPAEVRRAALIVVGELNPRDTSAHEAVLAALEDDDGEVRLRAIIAAGKLRLDKALPLLTERIKAGGPESEQAAEAVARLGAKGSRALHDLLPRVAPGLRRYIARALASVGATGGDVRELEILLDKDPGVVGAAVHSLASTIPSLDTRRKKSLADALLDLASAKKAELSPAGEAGVVRLVGLLDDARLADVLWDRIIPPSPTEVRIAALSALAKWIDSPSKEQRARLFRCAAERDFRVAAPALMILDKLPVTDKSAADWLPLFRNGDLAGRRLALTKVGGRDLADVAEALASQLTHPDRAYREEVLARLVGTEHGRKLLATRLVEADTADAAWPLARALAPLAAANPDTWAEALFGKASKYLETGDRRADPLVFVLKEGSAVELRNRLEKRALALVAKKDFESARLLYRALTRDPAAGFPYRMGLALCNLKTSAKELSADARGQDPCLTQFAEVVHRDSAAVQAELEKSKWLEAEDLYYLGFHFAESAEEELRTFGATVLRLLLSRFPRGKVATGAKNKLESAGLNPKKSKRG